MSISLRPVSHWMRGVVAFRDCRCNGSDAAPIDSQRRDSSSLKQASFGVNGSAIKD